jgi:hypothetical protein
VGGGGGMTCLSVTILVYNRLMKRVMLLREQKVKVGKY